MSSLPVVDLGRTFLVAALLLALASARSAAKDSGDKDPSTPAPTTNAEAAPPVPVKMKPFKVNDEPPKLCFGMSLSLWIDKQTKSLTAIYVAKVKSGSDADLAGIGVNTRILNINGQPVETMEPSFEFGTVLNQVFVNRQPGDRVTLTVIPAGSHKPMTVHLVNQARGLNLLNYLTGH